jgi:ubiquinone/menaquinone biosynthesis C-methylase UbiE
MARYDGIADWYDTEFLGEVHDPGRAAAVCLLGPGPGALLDLGCGTGAQTVAFRDQGWQVTGVDASEDMLRRARDRGLDVVHADASALPFEDACFDAAVSLWTHIDVDDFAGAVREVARVLKPGGPFVYAGGHTAAGLRVEHFEELGEDDYPYLVVLLARR